MLNGMLTPAPRTPPAQEGFALVEVMISAMIVILVTGAVVGLLVATGHGAAQERNRSQAFALAQEDQARLRTMRIAELNLNQKREVTVGGATYTVHSTGVFVENATGESTSCGAESDADYVRISSEVTWPDMGGRQPVLIQSIVSPVSGSLDPHRGKLEVKVVNADGDGISGVGLDGSGPGNFSGSTDENGCAIFANLPEGTYTLTPSLREGFVDRNGRPPGEQEASVQPSATVTKELMFGEAGTATVDFTTRPYGGAVTTAKASSIVIQNGLTEFPQTIESESHEPEPSITARLFPSSTTIFAGACDANNPSPGTGTPSEEAKKEFADVEVPAGGEASPKTIQLPPLNLVVKNSSGTELSGATVTATETESSTGEVCDPPLTRSFTTNEDGRLDEPALPYGEYEVCASSVFNTRVREGSYWNPEYVWKLRPHHDSEPVQVHSLNPGLTTISLSADDDEGECST